VKELRIAILTAIVCGMVIVLYYAIWISRANKDQLIEPIDKQATAETRALYVNLNKISSKGILFGQQYAIAHGIGWSNEDLRSDINDVCGSFPSIYGWEMGKIGNHYNIDSIRFDRIRFWINFVYERGSINTISWMPDNPLTGKNPDDTIRTVYSILPGGKNHLSYVHQLNLVANFILDLKAKDGTLIPIIFRPFPDQNKNWYWWGAKYCTPEEYIALWQFTIAYLRDTRNVHNILYVYSPNCFMTEDNYLERFPGNNNVDILGFNDFDDFKQKETIPKVIDQLRIIVNLSKKMNKIAAFTETGVKLIPDSEWWTNCLLNPIKDDSIAKKIAWLMIWSNNTVYDHYGPYPGHKSVPNFIKFEMDPYTLFEGDFPGIYNSSDN
jgi:mannan endo-1,4-beta-mannosidase